MPRIYPYGVKHVQEAAQGLEKVSVPFEHDRYCLGLGITSRCNFDCPICYYHGPGRREEGQDMPVSFLRHILNALPRLRGIVIGLEGEPILHQEFAEIIHVCANHAKNIVLISNGSRADPEVCQMLHKLPVSLCFLSIDATDESLYHRLRRGGNFVNFKQNASRLAASVPCALHATVFRENLASLAELPQFASSLGIQKVSFQQLRSHPGSVTRGIKEASHSELLEWLPKVMENAIEHQVSIEFERFFGGNKLAVFLQQSKKKYPSLLLHEYEKGRCQHADNMVGLCADGRLFPCAGDFEPVSLQDFSFDGIFNHPYLVNLRSLHKNGILCKACKICMNMQLI